MPKTLSQLVKESVDIYDGVSLWILPCNVTRVHGSIEKGGFIYEGLCINKEEVTSHYVKFIENEIARKKKMIRDDFEWNLISDTRELKVYNEAIDEDVTYLKGELEIIKKEL